MRKTLDRKATARRGLRPETFVLKPVTLVCPRIRAPEIDGRIAQRKWRDAAEFSDFVRDDGKAPRARTTLWLGHDDGYIYIAARCDEKNTAALSEKGMAYSRVLWTRDHVALLLDPQHRHINYFMFCLGPFDQAFVTRGTFTMGYRAGPDSRWTHHDSRDYEAAYLRYASHIKEGKYWSFEAAIPLESIEASPPQHGSVWGINAVRFTTWPVYQGERSPGRYGDPLNMRAEVSVLAQRPGRYNEQPVAYGDMVFAADAVRLDELDVGTPHVGQNRCPISVTTPAQQGGLVASTCVCSRRNGVTMDPVTTVPLTSDGRGVAKGTLAWKTSHYDDTSVLDIVVKREADGQVEWRGSYDIGWEAGSLPLFYLHKGEAPVQPPDPDPGDPLFLMKKAEFIAGRQRRFYRRNTAQGAPSDFTLESADGSVRFDLMKPDVFERMAEYIHQTYSNDADRLVGMMFLMAQPCMMRAHPAYDPGTSHKLEVLSLLRFGTGYCGHMARVMTAAINHMEVGNTGRRHRARRTGIGGHGIVIVEYRSDYVLLDSKHCCMFYRLDNRDLATLSEMRREPEIVRRAYPHWMPALMTFDERYIAQQDPDVSGKGGLIYPPGGPTL